MYRATVSGLVSTLLGTRPHERSSNGDNASRTREQPGVSKSHVTKRGEKNILRNIITKIELHLFRNLTFKSLQRRNYSFKNI